MDNHRQEAGVEAQEQEDIRVVQGGEGNDCDLQFLRDTDIRMEQPPIPDWDNNGGSVTSGGNGGGRGNT